MAENGGLSRAQTAIFPAWSQGFSTQTNDLAAFMSADSFDGREQEKCRPPFSDEDPFRRDAQRPCLRRRYESEDPRQTRRCRPASAESALCGQITQYRRTLKSPALSDDGFRVCRFQRSERQRALMLDKRGVGAVDQKCGFRRTIHGHGNSAPMYTVSCPSKGGFWFEGRFFIRREGFYSKGGPSLRTRFASINPPFEALGRFIALLSCSFVGLMISDVVSTAALRHRIRNAPRPGVP